MSVPDKSTPMVPFELTAGKTYQVITSALTAR
jgi:hypothetical protein